MIESLDPQEAYSQVSEAIRDSQGAYDALPDHVKGAALAEAEASLRDESPLDPGYWQNEADSVQSGWEMSEIDDDLVELTSDQMRGFTKDEGDVGLTFKVEGDSLQIHSAGLPEPLKGRGIGSQMYLRALEHAKSIGKGFESDIAPSRDAIKVYERLIEQGVPLKRKMVEAENGIMVQQFFASADDLKYALPKLR